MNATRLTISSFIFQTFATLNFAADESKNQESSIKFKDVYSKEEPTIRLLLYIIIAVQKC